MAYIQRLHKVIKDFYHFSTLIIFVYTILESNSFEGTYSVEISTAGPFFGVLLQIND